MALVSGGRLIYPTHHCFDDTMEFVEHRLTTCHPRDVQELGDRLFIVHALHVIRAQEADPERRIPGTGAVNLHAWVEEETPSLIWVWDFGIVEGTTDPIAFRCDRDDYYRQMQIVDLTRYTLKQVYVNNQAFKTYGPWKTEYLAHATRLAEP